MTWQMKARHSQGYMLERAIMHLEIIKGFNLKMQPSGASMTMILI